MQLESRFMTDNVTGERYMQTRERETKWKIQEKDLASFDANLAPQLSARPNIIHNSFYKVCDQKERQQEARDWEEWMEIKKNRT